MANEIHIDYEPNSNLYAIIRNGSGDVWYIAGQTFEAWGSDGHDADDYDIPLTDKDGNRYTGDFDSSISAGRYSIQVFLRAADTPSGDDIFLGGRTIIWTGSRELTADKLLANRAIQNKVTGAIDYYDDDGQTVILTHTPADGESAIERTPS